MTFVLFISIKNVYYCHPNCDSIQWQPYGWKYRVSNSEYLCTEHFLIHAYDEIVLIRLCIVRMYIVRAIQWCSVTRLRTILWIEVIQMDSKKSAIFFFRNTSRIACLDQFTINFSIFSFHRFHFIIFSTHNSYTKNCATNGGIVRDVLFLLISKKLLLVKISCV